MTPDHDAGRSATVVHAASSDDEPRQPPETFSDYAIRAIRQDLIEGRLRPGQRISAEELAANLGISHVPVREALRFLEAQGHFERGHRNQMRVAPTERREAEEIYALRAILEAEAHRVGVPLLTDDDLAELEGHFAGMAQAIADGDVARFAQSNRAFHFVPFYRSELTWMIRFLSMIWDAAARYQSSLFLQEGWEVRLQEHHTSLLDAMKDRDAGRVNRIMNEHRLVTVEASVAESVDGGQLG